MDYKKIILYFGVALVGVLIWNTWQRDYPPAAVKRAQVKQAQVGQQQRAQQSSKQSFVPKAFSPGTKSTSQSSATTTKTDISVGEVVTVSTDVLQAGINLNGGNIIVAKLPKYPVSMKDKNTPVQMFSPNSQKLYIAESGLTGIGTNIKFQADKTHYQLAPGGNGLIVTLTGKTGNGLELVKRFKFKSNSYAIKISDQISNRSNKTWQGSIYRQLVRRYIKLSATAHSRSYYGVSISSPKEPYEKLSFKDLNKSNLSRNILGGWVAMQQQYFLSAWVPPQGQTNHYYSNVRGGNEDALNNIFTVGYVQPTITLTPGKTAVVASTLYVGPEIPSQLKPIAKGLDLTIDYGFLWPISKLLFWIMQQIHNIIGNWGWSIILVTLIIKVVFYWFSDKSYKSMTKMREVAPRLQALKDRFSDDKQALSKATMKLYKEEKINPMGGCLPMLVQIPVFIALYYVLIESVELRQAPFMFWIHDLSAQDPFYVLPVLMGLSMLLQQKMSPPPPDPTQAKMMMLLPLVFTVFLATFPAGLVLYWLTNNLLSALQQWYVMKTYDPKKDKKPKRKRAKK